MLPFKKRHQHSPEHTFWTVSLVWVICPTLWIPCFSPAVPFARFLLSWSLFQQSHVKHPLRNQLTSSLAMGLGIRSFYRVPLQCRNGIFNNIFVLFLKGIILSVVRERQEGRWCNFSASLDWNLKNEMIILHKSSVINWIPNRNQKCSCVNTHSYYL